MARIKIKDLPKDVRVSQQEMKNVLGGVNPIPSPRPIRLDSKQVYLPITLFGMNPQPSP